ncbi:MAG TPA: glutamine-hydrolyzing carbamoyl-phosphate synthase small subunit, partial [Acetobacteraceae bacterium]|nr:glutamine-hydrolyzing carbamoyl-phosphate synthase small subunit [Acetobacteraceae bacterium]
MINVDEIVDRLGGPEEAARRLGVGPDAVRKWRQAGSVPSRHFSAIIAATGLTLADLQPEAAGPAPAGADAVLVLADGSVFWGRGFGAHTAAGGGGLGEVCFNTGMTGYQETLTDPSYAGQLICFTFPHIGNVGANGEDIEALTIFARGLVVKQEVTEPSNWRAAQGLDAWLRARGVPGICGVDTRALTVRIRDGGAPSGILAYPADGKFDLEALRAAAAAWPGLEGMDLAREVSCTQSFAWDETVYAWPDGYGRQTAPRFHVVAVDYGAKRNILRCLANAGCRVTVVPAFASAEDILRHKPDGVFLSNGPGDPAATGEYAVPAIQGVLASGTPVFGICLGHQLLALALGARTYKMARGHRGANQPVQDLATGRVEITSQNHGFAVDEASLPQDVAVTHVSLFDGSNEGIACAAKRAFSVQYHPEASPGP